MKVDEPMGEPRMAHAAAHQAAGGIELWNLAGGVPAMAGAQEIFNVVGRLHAPGPNQNLSYSLNGGPELPVFLARSDRTCERLAQNDDFNIDTCTVGQLQPENVLDLRWRGSAGEERAHQVTFPVHWFAEGPPRFSLDLVNAEHPQQVGQIVDGRWRICRDDAGRRCLEIRREDAGFDRIILFGTSAWGLGYEVQARLRVLEWTGSVDRGVGLLFKWRAHKAGGGSQLPSEWTSAIGMFYCPRGAPASIRRFPGGRLRILEGVNVVTGPGGRPVGQRAHKQSWPGLIAWATSETLRSLSALRLPQAQIAEATDYVMSVVVGRGRYDFTVWPAGERRPRPQVVVADPRAELSRGSVGLLAHHCAIRLYEFEVAAARSACSCGV